MLDGTHMMVIQMKSINYIIHTWQHRQPKWFTGEVQEHPRKDLVEIYERAYDEAVLEGYKLKTTM